MDPDGKDLFYNKKISFSFANIIYIIYISNDLP